MATQQTLDITNQGKLDRMASELLLSRPPADEVPTLPITDAQWARQAFIIGNPRNENDNSGKGFLDEIGIQNRYFNSAYLKWTDSSLGGNICINPFPQFTRYADIREPGLRANAQQVTLEMAQGDIGMGNYYSEALDDNMQVVHMRFGVPSYNSLFQFFTGFYNSSASVLARTGRFDDTIIDTVLKAGASVVGLAILPLAIVPIAIGFIGHAARFFMRWPASKFYYSKPAMPVYWTAVTNMMNQISVNKGVTFSSPSKQQETVIGKSKAFNSAEQTVLHKLFPDAITKNGDIDVKAIASRSKRLQMRQDYALNKILTEGGTQSWYGKVKTLVKDQNGGVTNTDGPKDTGEFALENYIQRFLDVPVMSRITSIFNGQSESDLKARDNEEDPSIKDTPFSENGNTDGVADHFLANLADGSDWVSFRVNSTGPATDSFSSSTGKSSLAEKINTVSSSARDMRINFAQGNIDPAGITSMISSGISSVISGAASLLQISGLAAVAGNAFVDIPDHWTESSASLNKSSYSFTLICPYGNIISQTMYLHMPLCCLLAGALPLATGKQSHTSPFLVELFDRGRRTTRLGLITEVTITRGTSNLGFNNDDHPLALDVSFTVTDLSSVVAMPILPGFSLNIAEGLFDPDSMYTDYLLTLSSVGLRDLNDRWPVFQYQWARAKANFNSLISPSNMGMNLAALPGINMLSGLMRGTERQ